MAAAAAAEEGALGGAEVAEEKRAKDPGSGNPLEQIERLLTCPICLDRYKQPKLLACQHTFCLCCLESYVESSGRPRLKCPECRTEHALGENGVQSLQTNLTLMSFLEIHLEASDVNAAEMQAYVQRFNMERCRVCEEKAELELCVHCERKCCAECRTAHVDMLKRDLSRLLGQVRRLSARVMEASKGLSRGLEQLGANGEQTKAEIRDYFNRYQKELRRREENFIEQVDVFVQTEDRLMRTLRDALDVEWNNLQDACLWVDAALSGERQARDDELARFKLVFAQGLEYLRSFQPDSEDLFAKKLRFSPGDDAAKLPTAIANFGELNVSLPQFANRYLPLEQQYLPRPFRIGLESEHFARGDPQVGRARERLGTRGERDLDEHESAGAMRWRRRRELEEEAWSRLRAEGGTGACWSAMGGRSTPSGALSPLTLPIVEAITGSSSSRASPMLLVPSPAAATPRKRSEPENVDGEKRQEVEEQQEGPKEQKATAVKRDDKSPSEAAAQEQEQTAPATVTTQQKKEPSQSKIAPSTVVAAAASTPKSTASAAGSVVSPAGAAAKTAKVPTTGETKPATAATQPRTTAPPKATTALAATTTSTATKPTTSEAKTSTTKLAKPTGLTETKLAAATKQVADPKAPAVPMPSGETGAAAEEPPEAVEEAKAPAKGAPSAGGAPAAPKNAQAEGSQQSRGRLLMVNGGSRAATPRRSTNQQQANHQKPPMPLRQFSAGDESRSGGGGKADLLTRRRRKSSNRTTESEEEEEEGSNSEAERQRRGSRGPQQKQTQSRLLRIHSRSSSHGRTENRKLEAGQPIPVWSPSDSGHALQSGGLLTRSRTNPDLLAGLSSSSREALAKEALEMRGRSKQRRDSREGLPPLASRRESVARGANMDENGDELDYERMRPRPRLVLGGRGAGPAQMNWPRGVCALPPSGSDLFTVADSSNHRIQVFSAGADGTLVRTFGQFGSGDGEFDGCCAVCVDGCRGELLVADRYNHRVQVFDLEGSFLRKFGCRGSGQGQFLHCWGLAVDEQLGAVYVADKDNHRVQMFDAEGNFLAKFGSMGDGPRQFNHPLYLAFHPTLRLLFVSDSANNRICVYSPDGTPVRQFGNTGPSEQQLKLPRGITLDQRGNVVVADSGNNRVHVFSPTGTSLRAFGTWGTAPGQFKGVEGVALVGGGGGLVVADRENNRVQLFS